MWHIAWIPGVTWHPKNLLEMNGPRWYYLYLICGTHFHVPFGSKFELVLEHDVLWHVIGFKSQKAHVFKPIFPKKKRLIFDVVILQNLAGMEAFTRPDAQIWLSPAESQQLRRPCDKSEQWPVGSPGDFWCTYQRITFPVQVIIKPFMS